MARKSKYTPQLKLKIVIESIESNDMAQTARRYGVSYKLISKWKQILLKNGHDIFESTSDQEKEKMSKKITKLEQMVGKKEVELDLLKNFSDFYASQDT